MPRAHRWLPGTVAVIGVLALLEIASRTGLLPARWFPPMSDVTGRLVGQLGDGRFWTDLAQTLQGWAIGLLIAIVVAVPAGLAIGSSWWLYRALRPVVEFLRPVPSVALIPLAILVYGSGIETKVFLVAFAALWPLLLQMIYGARDVDPVALETARSYRLRRGDTVARVLIPSVLPYLATGVRISSSVALVLAVTAELVVGSPGIGRAITEAQNGGDVELMYTLIAVTGLLGWGLNAVLRRVERPLLHWHASHRLEEVA
ncbi:nitrate ABC transporter permease [Pseudonocardia sulfidoxydans NBRC 16205]|uniref:Nitrate ABC transporter permease n=1 Tax=Pseudonocardia sulfidoxydans NBRC 16205 TaxID=1223511 RepID=A0A511DLN1_9PSEU|nr:ABC transporter permease [Pseudonocardia sulfidoxydans]GEL25297.1 nitrate ABC transporter permease [Pseudonocardia sulfidoxydans NBRC 16205]